MKKVSLLTLMLFGFVSLQAQEAEVKKQHTPEEMFAAMDANQDETVDLAEFTAHKEAKWKEKGDKKSVEAPDKAAYIQEKFSKIDGDQSGSLSLDEFKAYLDKKKQEKEMKEPEVQ